MFHLEYIKEGVIRMKRSLHVRTLFFIAIATVVFVPLIISPIIQHFYISNILNEKIDTLINEKLEQITLRIEDIIDDIIVASNVVVLDQQLYDLVDSEEETKLSKRMKVIKKLQNMENANLYPYNAITSIIDLEGNVYSTALTTGGINPNYTKQAWYQETIKANGFFIWKAPVRAMMDDTTEGETISLSRLLKSEAGKVYGVFVMNLFLERRLLTILDRTDGLEGEEIYLVNEMGDIILSSSDVGLYYDKELFKNMSEVANVEKKLFGEEVIVNSLYNRKTDWKIIHVIPKKEVYQETDELFQKVLFINIIVFLMALLFGYYVANRFTKPIRQLSQMMEDVVEHKFKKHSEIKGSHEINILSASYNVMIDRIEKLISDIQFVEREKQKKHLEALQAQISPHFLLNTLNGIKWLCVIEGAKNAEKMILSLGQLLENMYFKNDEIVSLKEEIDLLKSYVEIQKMRYGGRFSVIYDVEEFLDMDIPVLLLQPIIENAIIHGIVASDGLGEIIISVEKSKVCEIVFIKIKDNGIGIKQEEIDKIYEKKEQKISSIGIKNVNERIKLYYGNDCGVEICSENQGTNVILTIKEHLER